MPTLPGLKMLPGMMPILHSPAVITPGQFGPISRDFDPHSERFTFTMSSTGMPSVMHDDQRDFRIDRFGDRVGRAGRRNIDHARIGAGLFARFRDGVEHRQIEMRRAAFAGRGAADHLRAVGDRLLGMEGAVLAGEALADDLGVLVDEDGHHAAFFTASTIFCAASSRSSAEKHVEPGFLDDLLAELDIGAFEPHHQRHFQADFLHGGDHAFGDDVAVHDAAEDVDQDALHLRIGR